ncbi:MAG: VRR-NUC domain-containing protein, partial [Rhodobacteraceae bacterium]|nr:VRR-NUC domain-containing protein [Paracoccaceae bacterium]
FFEVKAPKKTAQENQKAIGAALIENGARWAVVRSINDVTARLEEWGVA